MSFILDRDALTSNGRTVLGSWTDPLLDDLSRSIDALCTDTGCAPVQFGRVVALRYTDTAERFSAFKAALYHSRYDDMANTRRFPCRIAAAGQSLEVIRDESVMLLFVGVGKTVYDAFATFGQGRLARVSAGFHHSVPWGIEIPVQAEDKEAFTAAMMPQVQQVAELAMAPDLSPADKRRLAEMRYTLPLCYAVPPFIMDFSVEALMTKVFPQRLWERSVAERDSGSVAREMWECCCRLGGMFEQLFKCLDLR